MYIKSLSMAEYRWVQKRLKLTWLLSVGSSSLFFTLVRVGDASDPRPEIGLSGGELGLFTPLLDKVVPEVALVLIRSVDDEDGVLGLLR